MQKNKGWTLPELREAHTDATREELRAREDHGEGSRPWMEARDIRIRAERALSKAEYEDEQRKRRAEIEGDPEKVADEVARRTGRW